MQFFRDISLSAVKLTVVAGDCGVSKDSCWVWSIIATPMAWPNSMPFLVLVLVDGLDVTVV